MESIGSFSALYSLGKSQKFEVFKAWDPAIGRPVILKVTVNEDQENDVFVQALLELKNEAQILGGLRHRFLTPIYQFDNAHDPPFLALEYFRGQSLLQLINNKYQLGLHQIILLLSKLTDVFAFLHDREIFHGDISLGNILLSQQFDLRLVDFGLARRKFDCAKSSRPQGTPDFLSPELLDGRATDHRSDLYSLAILLHILVTGDSPYPGKTAEEVWQARHLEELRFRPPLAGFGIHEESFLSFIKKALSYAPEDRFADIEEFANAFAQVVKKELPAPETEIQSPDSENSNPEGTRIYDKRNSTVVIPDDVAPWLIKKPPPEVDLLPFDANLVAAELPTSPTDAALENLLRSLEPEPSESSSRIIDTFSPQHYRNHPIPELPFIEIS